jgi:DNA-binding PadR family transcriptional regulator
VDKNSSPSPESAAPQALDRLDPILQHRSRLGALVLLSTSDAMTFSRLKELLNETDGNLGAQLRKLEEADYLGVRKEFLNRKPVSWYRITPAGQAGLKKHLEAMESLINAARG